MERRPAVGAEDLSLQTISDGSALFNTQSKCTPSFSLIGTLASLFLLFQAAHELLCVVAGPPDEINPLPVQIPVVKPDQDRANPKIGVSALAFSSDSRYLATKNGAWI